MVTPTFKNDQLNHFKSVKSKSLFECILLMLNLSKGYGGVFYRGIFLGRIFLSGIHRGEFNEGEFSAGEFSGHHFEANTKIWIAPLSLKEAPAYVLSYEFCRCFKNTCFLERRQTATSEISSKNQISNTGK